MANLSSAVGTRSQYGPHRPAGGCPAAATPCAALLGCVAVHAAPPPHLQHARPALIAVPPAAACAVRQAPAPVEPVERLGASWPADQPLVTGAAGVLSGHPDALSDWPAAEMHRLRPQLRVLVLLQTACLQRLRWQWATGWVSEAKSQTLRPLHRPPTAACTPAVAAAAMRPAVSAAAAAAAGALRSCSSGRSAALPETPCSAAEEQYKRRSAAWSWQLHVHA